MTLGEFFTTLGFVTGVLVFWWAARERKLLTDGMLKISGWALVGGAVGAKLSEYVAEGWPLKIPGASILDPTQGGKALLGGILGGWLAAIVAKRSMGIRRSTGDLFALALPAGEAVGRIGCYFNGCCYGVSTHFPIAIYQHGAWRHPTQIYSSVTAALIFGVCLYARNKLPKEGDLFKLYLLLFGVTRFGIEFLREHPPFLWGLSAMQWLCFELVIFGAAGIWMSLRYQGSSKLAGARI